MDTKPDLEVFNGEDWGGVFFYFFSLGNISNVSLSFLCRTPAWTIDTKPDFNGKKMGKGGCFFLFLSLGNVSNVFLSFFFYRMDMKPDRSERCDWPGVSVTFRRFGHVSVFRKRFVISEMFRDRT